MTRFHNNANRIVAGIARILLKVMLPLVQKEQKNNEPVRIKVNADDTRSTVFRDYRNSPAYMHLQNICPTASIPKAVQVNTSWGNESEDDWGTSAAWTTPIKTHIAEPGEIDPGLQPAPLPSYLDTPSPVTGAEPCIFNAGKTEQPHANGGEGSGNFGHSGRPGERGGSSEEYANTLVDALYKVLPHAPEQTINEKWAERVLQSTHGSFLRPGKLSRVVAQAQAIQGTHKALGLSYYAPKNNEHDVSEQARDEHGRWTAGHTRALLHKRRPVDGKDLKYGFLHQNGRGIPLDKKADDSHQKAVVAAHYKTVGENPKQGTEYSLLEDAMKAGLIRQPERGAFEIRAMPTEAQFNSMREQMQSYYHIDTYREGKDPAYINREKHVDAEGGITAIRQYFN